MKFLKTPKEIGEIGEAYAMKYLVSQNYKYVTSNYRERFGEIDLIMTDGEDYVFVEVKTRRGNRFGTPQSSINARKREKIVKTALTFLIKCGEEDFEHWRIDAIAVKLNQVGKLIGIEHFKNI